MYWQCAPIAVTKTEVALSIFRSQIYDTGLVRSLRDLEYRNNLQSINGRYLSFDAKFTGKELVLVK